MVEDGAIRAASDLGVTLTIQNSVTSDDILSLSSSPPDAIISSDPSTTLKLQQALFSLSSSSIVYTINSGVSHSVLSGADLHFGQDEYLAGKLTCQRLLQLGASNILLVDKDAGLNSGTVDRYEGCNATASAAGASASVLHVDPINKAQASQGVSSALSNDPRIDAIVALSEYDLTAVLSASPESNLVVGFDVSGIGEDCLSDGRCAFLVDQQEYLQGYYSVMFAAIQVTTTSVIPSPVDEVTGDRIPVSTGPLFVTETDKLKSKKCLKSGLIFCDDPDIPPYAGKYPLSAATDECPCVDRMAKKACIIGHGATGEAFWEVTFDGMKLGVEDSGSNIVHQMLPDRIDLTYTGYIDSCVGVDGPAEDMADALVISLKSQHQRDDARRIVDLGVTVYTMGSGTVTSSADVGAIGHVGQADGKAGFEASKRLHEIIGLDQDPAFLCIDHVGGGSSGVNDRCLNIKRYLMETEGGKALGHNIFPNVCGIENLNVTKWPSSGVSKDLQVSADYWVESLARIQVLEAVNKAKNDYGVTINGLIAMGQASCKAIGDLYGSSEDMGLACFDTNDYQLNAVKEGTIHFAIDQQNWLQGKLIN